MYQGKDPRRNASGNIDMTAYQAIKSVDQEADAEERFRHFLKEIFSLAEQSGLHIEERLVIKDRRTGKVWR